MSVRFEEFRAYSAMLIVVGALSGGLLANLIQFFVVKRMLDAGLKATVNSDDPAYFGGYLLDNYVAVAEALDLTRYDLVKLVCNSIDGSFLDETSKSQHLARIDEIVAADA